MKRGWRGGSSCDLASASSFGRRAFFLLRLLQIPSRLWRCALTLALQGKALRAIPAALRLAPLQSPPNRLHRIGNTEAVAVHRSVQEIHAASSLLHVRHPAGKAWPGRALVLRIELRCASLAPFGLPSLTPTARLPASGLRASLACGRHKGMAVACPAIFPDLITLLATVARGRVPSRRAWPCPRLRLRAAPTLRLSP